MDVGRLKTASIVDRIDGPSNWTIECDVHVLTLHEAGSFHYLETWLDGRRTSLGDPLPGEMWLAPAGRLFAAAAQGGAARYLRVEIPPELLAVAPYARVIAAHEDAALAALVRALAGSDDAATGPLLAAIAETLEGGVMRLPAAPDIGRRLDNLMSFIEARIETHLSVEEMAAEAGMSINSLIVHFARATGRTPAQYLLNQRLRRARWFLMNRPLTVAEIAFATGFSSHAHLCAAFRNKLGISPGAWRREATREGLL
ncbi:helix-turn-helix domain-containing protein [Sphingopyxis sp.]|uniref:AraC family transcriptional regulator n=1 Tax=Sphingopyxis sp. TaxID=1908224 RepID=UPI003BAA1E13